MEFSAETKQQSNCSLEQIETNKELGTGKGVLTLVAEGLSKDSSPLHVYSEAALTRAMAKLPCDDPSALYPHSEAALGRVTSAGTTITGGASMTNLTFSHRSVRDTVVVNGIPHETILSDASIGQSREAQAELAAAFQGHVASREENLAYANNLLKKQAEGTINGAEAAALKVYEKQRVNDQHGYVGVHDGKAFAIQGTIWDGENPQMAALILLSSSSPSKACATLPPLSDDPPEFDESGPEVAEDLSLEPSGSHANSEAALDTGAQEPLEDPPEFDESGPEAAEDLSLEPSGSHAKSEAAFDTGAQESLEDPPEFDESGPEAAEGFSLEPSGSHAKSEAAFDTGAQESLEDPPEFDESGPEVAEDFSLEPSGSHAKSEAVLGTGASAGHAITGGASIMNLTFSHRSVRDTVVVNGIPHETILSDASIGQSREAQAELAAALQGHVASREENLTYANNLLKKQAEGTINGAEAAALKVYEKQRVNDQHGYVGVHDGKAFAIQGTIWDGENPQMAALILLSSEE